MEIEIFKSVSSTILWVKKISLSGQFVLIYLKIRPLVKSVCQKNIFLFLAFGTICTYLLKNQAFS